MITTCPNCGNTFDVSDRPQGCQENRPWQTDQYKFSKKLLPVSFWYGSLRTETTKKGTCNGQA